MRDSSPETNTGPYLVYEKFEFGIFHCPCSLLGVSNGRTISDEYRTQTVRFRSYWLPVLLTLLNWSGWYNVIDETKIVSSKTVIWLCRFPKHSNIEVLTGAESGKTACLVSIQELLTA